MPSTNTSNLAETLVRLPRQLLSSPTMCNTLESVTLGNCNNIDDLVLLEDSGHRYGLLEETESKVDLGCDSASVDLDFHEVGFLLLEARLADLGVGEDTDDGAVFAHALELARKRLARILCVLLGIASESLLLRAIPVLVEATFEFIRKMGCPDSGERAEATGGLNVTDSADDNQRRGLDD
jgi:hypothetical protein